MNNLQDIDRIVQEHYTAAGQVIENSRQATAKEDAKKAESLFREGLQKLDSLKLSADDRRHFKMLREAFRFGVLSMRAVQRNNPEKVSLYGTKSADFAARYALAMSGRDR